jgi:hypothetical protein
MKASKHKHLKIIFHFVSENMMFSVLGLLYLLNPAETRPKAILFQLLYCDYCTLKQEAQGPGAQLTGSRQGRNRILKYV